MSSVDDRIVNMQFNNKQFLTGATESQRALEGLDKTIANTGNSKGLSTMATSVDQVSSRFSALQVAGVTALATIVSKATVAGLEMAKSLTIAPIADGFREYETNLKSVQTIMANTGEKIGVVNQYLNELNHYSDQTIYNFSQMADSIGKFTAAGVKLPAATDAIKGMANTAALTGANAMQLNSAMYQMSQALASGTIKLMDWNSLVNANMGTQNIQKALMATNRTLGDNGKLMDESIAKFGTFRDSLNTGWLTAETFTKTMKVMAGQTNAAGETVAFTVKELQKMGYARDAAVELNRLSAASIESATKIKSFTQLLDVVKESVGSGFAQVFQNLFGNLKEAGRLWTNVGDRVTGAVGTIFDAVNGMLLGWKQLGGYTALWNGFGNIFQALGNLIRPFVVAFQTLLPSTGKAGEGLANASKGFERFTEGLEKLTRGAMVITPVLVAIAKAIKTAFGMIGEAFDLIKMGVNAASGTVDIGENIVQGIIQGFSGIGGSLLSAVSNVAVSIIEAFKNVLGIHSPAQEMVPIGINIIEGVIEGLLQAASFLLQAVMNLGPMIINGVMGLGSFISAAFQQLFGGMDSLDFASMLNAIFTGGFILVATNMIRNMGGIATAVQNFLGSIGTSLTQFTEALGTEARAKLIMAYAVAIGVLAAALVVLSFLDADALGKSLAAMGVMLTLLVGSLYALGKVNSEMNIAMIGLSLLLISVAVLNLSAAVAILGRQDMETLAKGLGAMAITLGLLVAALFGLSKIKGSIEGMAGSILIIAIAMNALATAVLAFGLMDMKTLAKGLGAMAIGLGILVAAMLGMDKMKGSIEGMAGSILIVSAAMVVMATAVGLLGSMDMKTLAKGMVAMAIGLGIMVAALMVMSGNSAGVLAAAGAMLMMAAAMNMLVGVILILGTAPWETVAKGLTFVAAALAVFLLAGLGAMYVAPGLLALGVSLALIGAALFLAGAGMLAFGTGFALLAAAGVAGVTILVAAFNAFIALLPSIAIQMAAAFVSFLEAIANASPRIRDAMSKIFSEMLGIVKDAVPEIVDLVKTLMDGIFDVIKNYVKRLGELFSLIIKTVLKILREAVPDMVDAATDIMLAILRGLEQKIPRIANAAGNMIAAFIKAVGEQSLKIAKAGAEAVVDFLEGVADAIKKDEYIQRMQNAGIDIAVAIAEGISSGLLTRGIEMAKSAAENLASQLPGWMKKVLGINSPAKETIPVGMYSGMGVAVGLQRSTKMIAGAAEGAGKTVGKSLAAGVYGSVNEAILATAALVNAVVVTGSDAIAKLRQEELKQLGVADFEQRIADAEQKKADKAARENDRAQRISDRADRRAEKAREEQKKLEERAKKAKKESEAEYRRLMALAKQQEKHADKLKEAAKQQAKAAKQQEKAANKAEKAADKAQKAADAQRRAADRISQRREDAENWASMSAWDRLMSSRDSQTMAQGAVNRAGEYLASLQSQLSDLLKGGVTKKERDQVAKLRGLIKDTTGSLSSLTSALSAARARTEELFRAFVQEERKMLADRIADVRGVQREYDEARKAQAEYDAADTLGKAAIMQKRAEASQKASEELSKNAEDTLATADRLAMQAAFLGPARAEEAKALLEQANQMVDEAEVLAQAARDAADRAKDERDQASDLLQQAKDEKDPPSSPNAPGGGSSIKPSNAALQDAASAVDRYSRSLALAEEAIAAAPTVIQFQQTNTSPEALTASEIYRQTKNLLSAAEIKMGA